MRLCVCRRPAHPCADLIADDDVLADRAADDGHADARAVGCARMHTVAHASLHSSNHHRRDTHTHTLNVTHKQTPNAQTNTQRMHTHANTCARNNNTTQTRGIGSPWYCAAAPTSAKVTFAPTGSVATIDPGSVNASCVPHMLPPLAECVSANRMFAKRIECRPLSRLPPSDPPLPLPLPALPRASRRRYV